MSYTPPAQPARPPLSELPLSSSIFLPSVALVVSLWVRHRWVMVTALLCVLIGGRFLAISWLPGISFDESYYKIPAYALATYGRYHNPSVTNTDHSIFFAAGYPPLFMLALAGWFKVVGFGLLQSQVFSVLLACGVGLSCALLTQRLAGGRSSVWALIAGVSAFSAARFDRPDALGTVGLLAATTLLLWDRPLSRSTWVGAALAAAVSMLAQPIQTVFHGLMLGVTALGAPTQRLSRVLIVGAAAAALVAVELGMYFMAPASFEAVIRGGLQKSGPAAGAHVWPVTVLLGPTARFWLPTVALFAVVAAGYAVVALRFRSREGRLVSARPAVGVLVCAVVWVASEHDPNYFMFLIPLAVAWTCACLSTLRLRWYWVPLAAAPFVVGWVPTGLSLVRSFTLQPEERFEVMSATLARTVSPGSQVCADARLWPLLVREHTYYDLVWGTGGLTGCEYVVSLGYGTGAAGATYFDVSDEGAVLAVRNQFRVVYDSVISEPQRFMGIRMGGSRMGWGLRIYQRQAGA